MPSRGEDARDPAIVVKILVKIAAKMSQQHDRCPGLTNMGVVVSTRRSNSTFVMLVVWQHCVCVCGCGGGGRFKEATG